MGVRFGLDIGIASVGWAVVSDEYQILESGANLFEAAEASKNADRRTYRQTKRLLRRRRTRVKDFEKLWIKYGLPVPEHMCNNQLDMRIKGQHEELSKEEIYFVLKYMLLHRGISYLDDVVDDTNATGEYKKGLFYNQKELNENKLPCEIQYERLCKYGKYRGEITTTNNEEKITFSNVFTKSAYKTEITNFLDMQKKFHPFISAGFISEYMAIFERKREYYEGPGNEKSRTDYGKYTTLINPETGQYITEENIFEKLIGKCSIYTEERRISAASYTAQEFNLLNDLNNINVNNRKLSKEEKCAIICKVKTEKVVNMKRIISDVMGEKIEYLTGCRIDKNGKEIFHKMEQYNKIRREFEKVGLDVDYFSRDELDQIGDILTLNTEKEAILCAFKRNGVVMSTEMQETLMEIRRKNASMFSKWHKFSKKLMLELIPELYEQPKNQMQLLSEMGVFKPDTEKYKQYSKLPKEEILDDIYNPVVRRSVSVTVDIINALIKKYGWPKEIVIEMPRDRNTEEQKQRIRDFQKNNEKELKAIIKKVKDEYGYNITEDHFYKHKKLAMKLKLWNEQDGLCLYSGKTIDIYDLVNNRNAFEIDHIIPRSISFDDSRTNKVLVYATENQLKGNQTPYMYLRETKKMWGLDDFVDYCCTLKDKKKISKTKLDKLLFREDITKIDVLKRFISRNINDTRYASRVVLNSIQSFIKAKESETKVKVVRGSFTSQMRMAMQLPKDREKDYSHHAVDAMLICFSQMGYEAYHLIQKEFIDFENEEITNYSLWSKNMDDATYQKVMFSQRWKPIRDNIINAEKKVKYWHRVDKKANRQLCRQTIRGTRRIDDKNMIVYKLNIYDKTGYDTLKKKLSNGKESDFLMFHNDPKTWEQLKMVLNEYSDAKNAFVQYELETGDCFRKCSKKHNGPKVTNLKYISGEVGSCIDISHKYNLSPNCQKVVLENINPYRTDVYYSRKEKRYFLVGLKYSDFKYTSEGYRIDEKAYCNALKNEEMLQSGMSLNDLSRLEFEYLFSLYKNDYIEYELKGKVYVERFLSRTMPQNANYIETKPIECANYEKRHPVGLKKAISIKKIRTDILGNRYYAQKEKFTLDVDN